MTRRAALGLGVAAAAGAVAYLVSRGSGSLPPAQAPPGSTPSAPNPGAKVYVYTTGAAAFDPTTTIASLAASGNAALIGGMSWVFPWSTIEPAPGQYDWSSVDKALAATSSWGRPSILRIIAGQDSPIWATNSLPSVSLSFTNALAKGETITMPITWDPAFISTWSRFIAAYGARYNGDSRIFLVQMPGCGRIGEMALGEWAGWRSTVPPPNGCGSEPYSDSVYVSAWEQVIAAYRAAFPRTPSALDIGEPIKGANAVHPLVAAVSSRYGRDVWFQANGLGHQTATSPIGAELKSLTAITEVGWQMWAGNNSPGALMTALKNAIATNARYVEVYLSDCLKSSNTTALQAVTAA